MEKISFWQMMAGISAVSLLPRMLPVALFSHREFPRLLKKWLTFVAPSVLGALTTVSVLAPEGKIDISPYNLYTWAFLPTLVIAVKTRNLFYTLLTGIGALAILNHLFGV